uniref:IgGFc_binding domain-containing protein n=1 Tax=Rhabditophanes sp. KR3021 TaxID=114890 RepID=A0AC35TYL6_9BILA
MTYLWRQRLLICLSIWLITLGTSVQGIADSDGTDFVANFLQYGSKNPKDFSVKLYFSCVSAAKATVTYKYTSLVTNALVTDTTVVDPGSFVSVFLKYQEIVTDGFVANGNVKLVPDTRVFIHSDVPIKVLAEIYNINTGVGDVYLVLPTSLAGSTFNIQLPQSVDGDAMIIAIAGQGNAKTTIKVGVSINQGPLTTQNQVFDPTMGQPQPFIAFNDAFADSVYITSDQPISITIASTCVDLLYLVGKSNGRSKPCDYAASMAQPIGVWDCQSILTPYDLRVITGTYTNLLTASPSDATCAGNILPTMVYTNDNPVGKSTILGTGYSTNFPITSNTKDFGLRSSHAVVPLTRIGSPNANMNVPLNGAFMHLIPDTTQFITGDINFKTFYAGDTLEIYSESSTTFDQFTIDGKPISPLQVKVIPIGFFDRNYTSFAITIATPTNHVFNSPGKYIAYVLGKSDRGYIAGYGYIAGFNKSTLQSYPASTPHVSSTAALPTTTAAPVPVISTALPDDQLQHSYHISSDYPIVVMGAIMCDKPCATQVGECDYGAFVAMPMKPYDCFDATQVNKNEFSRIISTSFTKEIFVSPGDNNCEATIEATIFNSNHPWTGEPLTLPNLLSKEIVFNPIEESEFAITSMNTDVSMIRLGSPFAYKNDGKIKGAFMTIVPDVSQFVQDESSFILLGDGDYLEVYEIIVMRNPRKDYCPSLRISLDALER